MSIKTAGTGHFAIPTAPAAGTSCTSGSANTFTASYVQLIASTAAALYVTGIFVDSAAALAATYIVVQLATGGAGSETIVGQYLISLSTGSTVANGFRSIWPPIPVPISTRIACKTADSVGSKATLITLECLAQSNYVDDGVAVGTVTTVTNQLTGAAIATAVWTDTTSGDFTTALSIGKTVVNGVTLGTGLTINGYTGNTAQTGDSYARIGAAGAGLTNITLANDFSATMKTSIGTAVAASAVASVTGNVGGNVTGNITGTVSGIAGTIKTLDSLATHGDTAWATATGFATPTNITAGILTTVTNLTNAPTNGDLTAAMKSSITTACTASTPTVAVGPIASVGTVTGSVGSVTAPVQAMVINQG